MICRFVLSLFACAVLLPGIAWAADGAHPRLLLSPESIARIRVGLADGSGFARSLAATREKTDRYFISSPDVPAPVDPGGGYSHERHKRDGVAIHHAGILAGSWRGFFGLFDAKGSPR